MTDEELENYLRELEPQLTDEDIDAVINPAPNLELSERFREAALAAMRKVQRLRDVKRWEDEAIDHD